MLADGSEVVCSRTQNTDFFYMTIGGLGLTGVITWLHLQLEKIYSSGVETSGHRVQGIAGALSALDKYQDEEYVICWLDLLNPSGIDSVPAAVMTSTRSAVANSTLELWEPKPSFPMGIISPFYQRLSNKAFNLAYKARATRQHGKVIPVAIRKHLFTWDYMPHWNDLYGSKGFYEYQFVMPADNPASIEAVFATILQHRADIFLAAMKLMSKGEGLLSYGLDRGVSILLDLPCTNKSARVINELHKLLIQAGGHVHLAKDSFLTADKFFATRPDDIVRFKQLRTKYGMDDIFKTNLSERLGL